MRGLVMTIHIDYETTINLEFDPEELIHEVATVALDYEECPYETEINIILTDNSSIQEINKEYREIDSPTDVLSFPFIEYKIPSDFSKVEQDQADCFHPDSGELMLGDIIISMDKVHSQATEYGHSVKRELGFLIVHSILHLCGYDHMEEEERKVMEAHQDDILRQINLQR